MGMYPGQPVEALVGHQLAHPAELDLILREQKDSLQCVVAGGKAFKGAVPFGKSQMPELWDYADGIDTMEFLLSL
mgnify:CR=1 FL=1